MFDLILYCYFYFSFENFNYGDKINLKICFYFFLHSWSLVVL